MRSEKEMKKHEIEKERERVGGHNTMPLPHTVDALGDAGKVTYRSFQMRTSQRLVGS